MRISFRLFIVPALFLLLVPCSAVAQSRHGPRPVLAQDREVALARSAAPEAISAEATVWRWQGERYVVADSGSNGVHCYLARLWVPSVEPHCFDPEAAATIMPILMRKVELYAAGIADSVVEQRIAADIAAGRLRVPSRPAVTYMMSAAQVLVGGNGATVGAWQPHLMIYYPGWTGPQAGLAGFVAGVGFIENPGTPMAALVVPLRDFVPAPDSTASRSP